MGAALDDATAKLVADIETALAAGNRATAQEIAHRAISRGLRHPTFFVMRAERMELSGHLQFALDDYQRASDLAPRDIRILECIAALALKTEAFERAVAAYDAALALQPGSASLRYGRAFALTQRRDLTRAQQAFESVLELEPEHADALAGLALNLARRSDAERARALGEKALALRPSHVTAKVALIRAEMADGCYAEAEARIASYLDSVPLEARPEILAIKGDILDAQARYREAFQAYVAKNDVLRQMYGSQYAGATVLDFVRHHSTYFENEEPDRWRAPKGSERGECEGAGHVFLLGFMRSGTTLLQQILTVNPNVAVLEEEPLLSAAREQYLSSARALDALANLGPEDVARLRRQYWQSVSKFVPYLQTKIVLDKHPLNTENLPLIAKLFPQARIILALRDPRDVVLSCFRRNFKMSAVQHEFLSLERCARYYTALMRLAEIYREKLSLNVLEHRYEDMIDDFDAKIRAVCEFSGIAWTDSMRRFNETAPRPELVSPSTSQVGRPLYAEGIGHWRHYAAEMARVMPILEPWVVKFGYSRD